MSEEEVKIKFILIGDPVTLKVIGTYPEDNYSKKVMVESQQIFNKFCSSKLKSKETRNKITDNLLGNYYFILGSDNVFYLILANEELKERDAFSLIGDLQIQKICLMVDSETSTLNEFGQSELNKTVQNFLRQKNKIEELAETVNETKEIVKENMTKMVKNAGDLEDLEKKAVDLKENAKKYNDNAVTLRKKTWWQKCRCTIVLVAVVIVALLIFLPIHLS